ncbi:MAG: VWA domain-containing protein [Planctomycetota bacterium]
MDVRFHEFDPSLLSQRELLERLHDLFRQLLLWTNGDVEEALALLEQLAEQHDLFEGRLDVADVRRYLERVGDITPPVGERDARLTARGERGLRTRSLEAMFKGMRPDVAGDHRVPAIGQGGEPTSETRRWEFGDRTDRIAFSPTLENALRRGGIEGFSLMEEDLEVFEVEHSTAAATVMMIDVSHSMVLYGEDRITPAKEVALAMAELVTTRFPKDSLDVVLFGDDAWRVPLEQLPYIGVGPFHTNTRAGLRLAREILRKKRQANRQILMITDGKPSCLTEPDGSLYKNPFGLDRRVVNKTLEEADHLRRLSIPVTSFLLTEDPTLVEFIETFTRTNRGRAYLARPDALGSFVFVDYLRNRRRRPSH